MNNRSDYLYNWFEYGVDYRRRVVRIDEDIDETTASYAISGFLALDSSPGPITIRLSSFGGEWWPGIALYDAIMGSKNHVTIVGMGYVMSMGTVILQAGDERLLTPNTDIMIHEGYNDFEGSSTSMRRYAKKEEHIITNMENIYLERIKEKHPKFTRLQLQRLLSHDTYLTADDAVQLGLADAIIREND